MVEHLDYQALGLRCGLEIHQQLATKKLFCNCPSALVDDKEKPDLVFVRKLAAVEGESGAIDQAALAEQKKQKYYRYHFYKEACCLVEMDEEPPHPLNEEALKVTLQVVKLLKAKPLDQIHVMRKTVVDGSNTSGFQRTALVALNGVLDDITIQTICLEEDAAKIVERTSQYDIYNLSRLGIPLIEIATGPDITSPEQAKTVAEKIGMILRSTGKVKRGIGTIRQDLNVSIKDGVRVEIKGVQELKLIPTIIEYEVLRQKNMIELYQALQAKNIQFDDTLYDLTELLHETSSKVLRFALEKNGKILAMKLPQHKGFLGREIQPGRRYGTELSDYAKTQGVKGLFHSDELPNYGITEEEVAKINAFLHCAEDDAFILIAAPEEQAKRALTTVLERAKQLTLLKEVRNANPDGTSSYLRPMPGAARMYPETDIAPVIPPSLEEIPLPELLDEKIKRFKKMYQLNDDLATLAGKSSYDFDALVKKYPKVEPSFLATVLFLYPKEIKKRFQLEVAIDAVAEELFGKVNDQELLPEAVKEALIEYAEKGHIDYEKYKPMDEAALELLLKKIIEENQGAPFGALMGKAMAQLRGKVEGKRISEKLKQLLQS